MSAVIGMDLRATEGAPVARAAGHFAGLEKQALVVTVALGPLLPSLTVLAGGGAARVASGVGRVCHQGQGCCGPVDRVGCEPA
jgi:hypothetical protein